MFCNLTRTTLRTLIAVLAMTAASVASSDPQFTGAIYTSVANGTTVNANLYDAKQDVYLNGGPQNTHGAGRLPPGTYYFQVTDPSGHMLLSTDLVACRQLTVNANGVVFGADAAAGLCAHTNGSPNPANGSKPVQLWPFDDTPNNGGEYKAFLVSQDAGIGCGSDKVYPHTDGKHLVFPASCEKTDNFKVRKPLDANIVACKFNDLNGNGAQDAGEPTIAGWPITATGVADSNGLPNQTVATVTGDDGCVAFTVPEASKVKVTLTEGTDANWYQTAPANRSYDPSATSPAYVVAGGVVSAEISGGQILDIDFGNRQALRVRKSATPSYKINWSIAKNVDNTEIKTSASSAVFNYTVNVSHDTGSDFKVTGNITLDNDSPTEITGVNVSDAVDNGATSCVVTGGTGVTVPANGQVVVAYVCTYASLPDPGTNTATATWGVGGSSAGTVAVDFSGTVPNDASVLVNDTLGGSLGTVNYTYVGPKAFTYPYTVAGTAGTCVTQDNTASYKTNTSASTGSASKAVTLCVGKDLTVEKDARPTFTRTYTWAISKDVDKTYIAQSGDTATFKYTVNASQTGLADSGWTVTGTITVTNPNDWEDVTVNVADAINNGGACTVNGVLSASLVVPKRVGVVNGSNTAPYVCTYSASPTAAAYTNTATATWITGTATGTAYTPNGTASGTASGGFTTPTTTVDPVITVTDTFDGVPTTLTTPTLTATNAPAYAAQTFTYWHTVTTSPGTCRSVDNTATFKSTTTNTTGSASKTVKLCVGKDLTVSKIATPAFKRTYAWGIKKSVDKTLVEQVGGGTATFNYAVDVKQTGYIDSAWTVDGTITVVNQNEWEDVTVNVSDDIGVGATCVVTGGAALVVPRRNAATATDGSATVPYLCTYTTAPTDGAYANTAKATWNPAVAFTPTGGPASGTAVGTASGSFVAPTSTVNATITVTDTYNSVLPATILGTLTATDGPVFASQLFPDSKTLTVPDFNCVTSTNQAAVVDGATPPATIATSALIMVKACGPAKTGALTIGFWQNKNGQGIIKAQTAGTCVAGTWLSGYAPFMDLPSGATCGAVATYVFNVIKAATSAGATMNPMLKAQMLATSLDVYFSDPALGGNKINSPAPIGGKNIDLTKICKDIGACTNYENVSSVFGPASSLTVLEMLAYAASQSNSGGSSWYGNIKTTQEFAKDAFDAINNEKVFSP